MEQITKEEFNDIISKYLLLIEQKVARFIDINRFDNIRKVKYHNEFYKYFVLLERYRHITYTNMSKKELIKLRTLINQNKLKDIFICFCGAIHTTFTYDSFIHNHQYKFRHFNFIKRHQEVRDDYNNNEFEIINEELLKQQQQLKEYNQWLKDNNLKNDSSESDSSESDSSEEEN